MGFDQGSILYKENDQTPVEGVGHFEPLRHYAEVHLRLEPSPAGSGLSFDSDCSLEVLASNWQSSFVKFTGQTTFRCLDWDAFNRHENHFDQW